MIEFHIKCTELSRYVIIVFPIDEERLKMFIGELGYVYRVSLS